MTRTEIRLDTLPEINRFVNVMSKLKEDVYLEDGSGIRVNAKSLLGCVYSCEWTRVYVFCEKDISAHLMPWMV